MINDFPACFLFVNKTFVNFLVYDIAADCKCEAHRTIKKLLSFSCRQLEERGVEKIRDEFVTKCSRSEKFRIETRSRQAGKDGEIKTFLLKPQPSKENCKTLFKYLNLKPSRKGLKWSIHYESSKPWSSLKISDGISSSRIRSVEQRERVEISMRF